MIDAGASYIHASLGDALEQKPSTGTQRATIVGILHDHIGGRVPLMAAGRIRTPAQADSALNTGLSLVAVGQSLVINPDWVEYAFDGRDGDVRLSISAGDVSRASIPGKLWNVIEATPGWFDVVAS
nr:hypothetical protein [uncultured Duganella sp.]